MLGAGFDLKSVDVILEKALMRKMRHLPSKGFFYHGI